MVLIFRISEFDSYISLFLPLSDFKFPQCAFSHSSHKKELECSCSKLFRNVVIIPLGRTLPKYDQGWHCLSHVSLYVVRVLLPSTPNTSCRPTSKRSGTVETGKTRWKDEISVTQFSSPWLNCGQFCNYSHSWLVLWEDANFSNKFFCLCRYIYKTCVTLDFRLSRCSECWLYSFFWEFPGVLILCADVFEHTVPSS